MNTLEKQYKEEMVKVIMDKHGVTNVMAAPKLLKIVVNCGLGEALADKKVIERMGQQLEMITGQKPQVMLAKKAISSFKLRIGDAVGLKITLRGQRMYDFLTKFVQVALPRVRDFRGIPTKGFDGHGNYTLGVKEQIIFPELEYSLIDKPRGFELTFVTNAPTDEQARTLLTLLGLPFAKE